MFYLRDVYPTFEESWLYRVKSTKYQCADGSYEWLYFYAKSGSAGCSFLDDIVDHYGRVIDIASAQVFDETVDSWCDLYWEE